MSMKNSNATSQAALKSAKVCLHINLNNEDAKRNQSEESTSNKDIVGMIKLLTERYRFASTQS